MSALNWVGVIAVLCAVAGVFLVVADLAEAPRLDRLGLELALFAPLALWIIGRRLQSR